MTRDDAEINKELAVCIRESHIDFGVDKTVPKEIFVAFGIGMMQALYNKNNGIKNLETEDILSIDDNNDETFNLFTACSNYTAFVMADELCRYGYDMDYPTAEQVEKMDSLIEGARDIRVKYQSQRWKVDNSIFSNWGRCMKEGRKKVVYKLRLDELFCIALLDALNDREGNIVEPADSLLDIIEIEAEDIIRRFARKTREAKEEIMSGVYDHLSTLKIPQEGEREIF